MIKDHPKRLASAGDAGMAKVGDVMIHDGWTRASIGSAPNSAAYMILMTHGDAADKLVGATTPVAETAELHDRGEWPNDAAARSVFLWRSLTTTVPTSRR